MSTARTGASVARMIAYGAVAVVALCGELEAAEGADRLRRPVAGRRVQQIAELCGERGGGAAAIVVPSAGDLHAELVAVGLGTAGDRFFELGDPDCAAAIELVWSSMRCSSIVWVWDFSRRTSRATGHRAKDLDAAVGVEGVYVDVVRGLDGSGASAKQLT
jgi:hypothetical protein